jgi:hypothetical protein
MKTQIKVWLFALPRKKPWEAEHSVFNLNLRRKSGSYLVWKGTTLLPILQSYLSAHYRSEMVDTLDITCWAEALLL